MGDIIVTGLVPNTKLKYSLINIKFITPTEHTIDSTRYSLEVQLEHTLHREYYELTKLTKFTISILFTDKNDYESDFLKNLQLDESKVLLFYAIIKKGSRCFIIEFHKEH